MTVSRIEIRVSEIEKDALASVSQQNGMTVSEYIKYKLFNNNPELSSSKFIYETPLRDRHQYITTGILNEMYWMLFEMNNKNVEEEKMTEFLSLCRRRAKKSMSDYGYLKIAKDE